MDMRIELLGIPVTDIDASRDFYANIGWNIDYDMVVSPELRFVQVTPPGSACSIAFGTGLGGLTAAEPGSSRNIQAVIDDADAARDLLITAGVDASDVEELAWGRFVTFPDPDGNVFILQQLPARS